MTDRELDRLACDYLEAVDRQDFEALNRIWALAVELPEIEAMLHGLHAAGEAEVEEEDRQRAAAAIGDAVQKHLPSAAIEANPAGPVTLAEVADDLFRAPPPQWPAEAHALNDRLRSNAAPVPETKSLAKLLAWAGEEFGSTPESYWRAFRDAAIRLQAARGDAEYGLAARSAKRKGPQP